MLPEANSIPLHDEPSPPLEVGAKLSIEPGVVVWTRGNAGARPVE